MDLVSYTSRRKEVYYLKKVKTKKGNLRYYVIKNIDKVSKEDLVYEMPDGYEFYENIAEYKISIRKIVHSVFSEEEKKTVESVMDKHENIQYYSIELDKEALVLHTSSLRKEDFEEFQADIAKIEMYQRYDVVLVFIKKDEQYVVLRPCHFPGYPDWIPLETNPDLNYLASKYTPHIYQESMLHFWIEGEEDF